jgi:hypothetical protein
MASRRASEGRRAVLLALNNDQLAATVKQALEQAGGLVTWVKEDWQAWMESMKFMHYYIYIIETKTVGAILREKMRRTAFWDIPMILLAGPEQARTEEGANIFYFHPEQTEEIAGKATEIFRALANGGQPEPIPGQ